MIELLLQAERAMSVGLVDRAEGLEQGIGRGGVRHAVARPRERAEAHLDQVIRAVPDRDLLHI